MIKSISYKMDDFVSVGNLKTVKAKIREYKQTQFETSGKIEKALMEFAKSNDSSLCSIIQTEVTAYDEEFVVHAIGTILFNGEEFNTGFMEVFFILERGGDDPKAIVKIFEQK